MKDRELLKMNKDVSTVCSALTDLNNIGIHIDLLKSLSVETVSEKNRRSINEIIAYLTAARDNYLALIAACIKDKDHPRPGSEGEL